MSPESTRATSLVELQDLTKIYGGGESEVRALAGVSFRIDAGEFVAVMGASGSGKSTCLNMLGCLDRATSGHYLFCGLDVGSLTIDQLALLRRHYLGFVFQGYNLLARTSALENVELPLVYRGIPAAERRRSATIVTSPRMLLADEPTGNLDSARKVEIMNLLRNLNQDRKITIVMVTHEPDMAEFASRIIHFKDGLIERDRVAEEATA